MTVWRARLDVTTNWAILVTGGLATFALGSPGVPHFVLLLGLALIAVSLAIEARRYRRLHHSKWRLHVLETCYFASLLEPQQPEACAGWRRVMAKDLREPQLLVTWFTAINIRLRRNYLLLLYFVTTVWVAKLFVHPRDPVTLTELWNRLAIEGLLPSWIVAASAASFLVLASVLALSAHKAEAIEEQATGIALRADARP